MKTVVPAIDFVACRMITAGVVLLLAFSVSAQTQNLFVVTYANGSIDEVTPGGVESVFTTGTGAIGANDLVFDSEGDLFSSVDDNGNGNIYEYINQDGTLSSTPTLFASGFDDPLGEAVNSEGDLFATSENGDIYEITPGGVVSTYASNIGNPWGLAFNASGDLFAVDFYNGVVDEFTPGGTKSTFATLYDGPTGVVVDSQGNVYVARELGGDIIKITPNGTKSTFATGLTDPDYLAINSANDIFAQNLNNGEIIEIQPNGTESVFASGLDWPYGLTFQPVPEPPFLALASVGVAAFVIGLFHRRPLPA